MILICLLAAVASLLAYFVTASLSRVTRVIIAALVFLIPPAAIAALVVVVGDPAAPGDVTVRVDEPGYKEGR